MLMLTLMIFLVMFLSSSSLYSSLLCHKKLNRNVYKDMSLYCNNNDNLIIKTDNNNEDNDDEDSKRPDDDVMGPVGPLPSVSSRVNFAKEEPSMNMKHDLWIVGCGTLGNHILYIDYFIIIIILYYQKELLLQNNGKVCFLNLI